MKRREVSVANETTGGLTTLARVKLELGITGTDNDALLRLKIREATSDIELRIRPIRRATVVEEFWPDVFDASVRPQSVQRTSLQVSRYPIESVSSIVIDGVTQDVAGYRTVAAAGELHSLNTSGGAVQWNFGTLATVTYVGGYEFPDDTGESLPPVLEAACLEMITMFWRSRGRDPLLKAEENPGVARFEYWVGAIGASGDLPPSIQGKLSGFLKDPVFA